MSATRPPREWNSLTSTLIKQLFMNNNEQEKAVASNRRQEDNITLVGSSHLHVCEIISKRPNCLYCLLNLFTNRVMRNVDKIIEIFAQWKNRKSCFFIAMHFPKNALL